VALLSHLRAGTADIRPIVPTRRRAADAIGPAVLARQLEALRVID
jgi:hypothetical protein